PPNPHLAARPRRDPLLHLRARVRRGPQHPRPAAGLARGQGHHDHCHRRPRPAGRGHHRAPPPAPRLLAAVTMVAAPWIIRLYIHSGSPAEREAAIELGGQLLAMFLPQILSYGGGAVMTGLLNAPRRFGVPMFAPILNNLVVIAVGLTFHALVGQQVPQVGEITTGQKLLLGLGTTAGVAAMTLVQWPFLRRIGFRFHFVWNWRD